MRTRSLVAVGLALAAGVAGSALYAGDLAPSDPRKLVFTFTVSQWSCKPEAMKRMAEIAHGEGIPASWIVNYATAVAEKAILEAYHRAHGDEVVMIRGAESLDEWRKLLPWARLNMVCGPRPSSESILRAPGEGVRGIWGYCDQQVGIDGITHWGCPWGLFYISPKTTFIPSAEAGQVVGSPWTVRDLHKCYHLGNAINFGIDAIEMIRSKTLCRGKDITLFQDLFDELLANVPWNERVYCCFHEEADGPYIEPGKSESVEGAKPDDSAAMYEMMREFVRYAKRRGVTITTLPAAVEEYRKVAGDWTMPSTLLTRDKHHGLINWYADPIPTGIRHGSFGPAGHFPDTLFHYDKDCQLVFVHPDVLPRTVLDYRTQRAVGRNEPYPKNPVSPTLIDWQHLREGDTRTYRYRLQSFYSTPYGLAEWGRFKGWRVAATDGLWAKIIDEEVLLVRLDLNVDKLEHNQRWSECRVKLVKIDR